MKDKLGSILIVLVLTIAVVFSTYSWFTWKNERDKRIGVKFSTSGVDTQCITYSTNQSGSKFLIPVSNKENGYITSINIVQSCDNDLELDFNLKLTKLANGLKDETFKYMLMEGTRVVAEDNFAGKRQGDTLLIADGELIGNNPKNYKLYLWIDGNTDNNDNLQNQSYEFELTASVTG